MATEIHAYRELDQALRALAPSVDDQELLDAHDRELCATEERWSSSASIGLALALSFALWAAAGAVVLALL